MVPSNKLLVRYARRLTVLLFALSATLTISSMGAVAEQSGTSLVSPLTKLLKPLFGSGSQKAPVTFQRTRFVVELERPTEFDVYSLVNPNRVVLQLPAMRMNVPQISRKTKGGLVTAVRGGRSAPGRTSIVIQVAAPVVVENAVVEPHADGQSAQLRLDIVPSAAIRRAAQVPGFNDRVSSLGAIGLQPPVPRKAETTNQRNARTYKPLIVVDPGHGGYDSGAKKNGVLEKNAVLAFGLLLREKLLATGRYRVRMTRDTDVFIKLGDRRKFAERNKADLFISVHADYARSSASGATIYSLRKRVAERLKRSARRSMATRLPELKRMKASASADRALRGILADLARRDVDHTSHQTNLFTETVIKHMGRSTDLRKRPHRSAAFKVLRTAKMPAVLIELAYVSNRRDARRLQSRSWRNKVSKSIVKAVDNYFDEAARLPM